MHLIVFLTGLCVMDVEYVVNLIRVKEVRRAQQTPIKNNYITRNKINISVKL